MKKIKKWKSMLKLKVDDHEPEDDHDGAEAILAFRTITTMLSLIQSSHTKITGGKDPPLTREQRNELRVLDALASVTVRRYEITAVVGKKYDGSGDNIQVLCCVNNLESALQVDIPQISGNRSGQSRFRWRVSPNPRIPAKNPKDPVDSLTTQNTSMTLVNPDNKISGELSNAKPDELLDTFLGNEW
jgi:hypothetical protein